MFLFWQKSDSGLFSESKTAPPPKKTSGEVQPPPATQPRKPMSGGGLFSDEDEDEGGGLFSAPAARPQAKADVKSKPKAKTTISLFDDDEQGEDEDFFAATVTTKATGYFQLSVIIIMMIHMYVLTWKLFWFTLANG